MTAETEVRVPAEDLLPGAKSVALFFITTKAGIGIELTLDGGGDTIDPHDPAHCLALYVQHNALQLMPQAALWFMQLAAENKKKREAARAPQSANDSVLVQSRQSQAVVLDAQGNAILPEAPASAAVVDVTPPAQPEFVSEGGTPD
jgi:hypothetical protein